jgi:hypothetical protein
MKRRFPPVPLLRHRTPAMLAVFLFHSKSHLTSSSLLVTARHTLKSLPRFWVFKSEQAQSSSLETSSAPPAWPASVSFALAALLSLIFIVTKVVRSGRERSPSYRVISPSGPDTNAIVGKPLTCAAHAYISYTLFQLSSWA